MNTQSPSKPKDPSQDGFVKVRPLNAPVRIALPVMLTGVLFVGTIFGLFLPLFKEHLMADRREMIRELTRSAWSTLNGYHQQELEGRLTRRSAQQQAAEHVGRIRYGSDGKDYFWINDMQPRLIVHPYRQDLEGRSIANFSDPSGKRLFVEMVDTVRQHGEGYVDYQWQWKDDPTRVVPKISFVKGFEPWGWVVGTGIYVEDVREQIGTITRKLTLACVVILMAIGGLSGIIIWQGAKAEAARQNAEMEAQMHREQLFQADKMATLGTLVSGVAHEVNNPATFIMLNAPILERVWSSIVPILDAHMRDTGDFKVGQMQYSQLKARMPSLVSNIRDGADRIKSIVADLKDYARPSPSTLMDTIQINTVCNKAIGLVSNLIQKSTQRFEVRLAQDLPAIRGNTQRIEQVIINLLVNACEALDRPQQSIHLATGTDAQRHEVRVTIHDEGTGIDPAIVDRIRDPFFTTKRDSGGTGLGLAIVERIVAEHGGRMHFTSVPQQGTTVQVTFPVTTDPAHPGVSDYTPKGGPIA
jgi:signal transduction histidine kinase